MKMRYALPLLVWTMLVSLPALAAPPTYDFKALMQKELDAWGTMDINKAAAFYAKDSDNVYYDVAPLKYNGWNEYAAGVKQNFPDIVSVKETLLDDARTHQHGALAWGTGTVHCVFTDQAGAKQEFDARWTLIWEKRGKDWLVVHEHFSAPLPAPAQ